VSKGSDGYQSASNDFVTAIQSAFFSHQKPRYTIQTVSITDVLTAWQSANMQMMQREDRVVNHRSTVHPTVSGTVLTGPPNTPYSLYTYSDKEREDPEASECFHHEANT